jgi:hypothetical protein
LKERSQSASSLDHSLWRSAIEILVVGSGNCNFTVN